MGGETYEVMFEGEIVAGFNIETVEDNFRSRFKVPEDQIDSYFSGLPIVLKSGLSLQQAERLKAAVHEVGGVCQVQVEPNSIKKPLDLDRSSLKPRSTLPASTISALQEKQTIFDPLAAAKKKAKQVEETKAATRLHEKGCAGIFLAVALVLLAISVTVWWARRPVYRAPGILAPQQPQQQETGREPFNFRGYRIEPLAEFQLRGVVLSAKNYRGGMESDLSPTDLALGWGPMSDSEVIRQIDINQRGRFYFWRVQNPPIPMNQIARNSANMHMVPANEVLREGLGRARTGDLIALQGVLVRIQGPGGWRWSSSLSRNDVGNGACELIWLEHFEIL